MLVHMIFFGICVISFLFLYCYIPFARKYIQSGTRDHLVNIGEHAKKTFTPTMGGFVFLVPLCALLFFHMHNPKAIFIVIATLTSLLVGAYDDYRKIFYKKGISAFCKFSLQALGALLATVYWYYNDSGIDTALHLGFFDLQIGIFYILWATFVIVGTSHAVNLTDGLDGLATTQAIITLSGCVALSLGCFGDVEIAMYAYYMLAACLVFLYFNRYPAKVIMGDVGALALGAYVACLFLSLHSEFYLVALGLFFVIETLSVIIQYVWWKLYKKRFFLCAPIHHHFEKKGWKEKNIVLAAICFSIIVTTCVIAVTKYIEAQNI